MVSKTDKKYTDDLAKDKSRELVRSMIERTILTFRKPKDVRVLCFPGIDAEEIFQVYDQLKIPRGNIVGVEREPEIAEVLENKNLGIKVVRSSIEDYVAGQDNLIFDVVSLDYTGPLQFNHLNTIRQLTKKQRRNHFVYHQANLMKRDKTSIPWYAYGYAMNEHESLDTNKPIIPYFPDRSGPQILQRVKDLIRFLNGDKELKDIRCGGYSTALRAAFAGGDIEATSNFFKWLAGRNYPLLLDGLEEGIGIISKGQVPLNRERLLNTGLGTVYFPLVQNLIESTLAYTLRDNCHRQGLNDENLEFAIWMMLYDGIKPEKFFREKEVKCYTYISESSSPMMGDVYFLSYPERTVGYCHDLCSLVGYPDREFSLSHSNFHQVLDLIVKWTKGTPKFISAENIITAHEAERNRIFLGSSARKKIKPLTEISPISQLTKEEVIDLLSSNIPVDEIIEAFPDSFTPAQLHAYKAHITMGTYSKEEK